MLIRQESGENSLLNRSNKGNKGWEVLETDGFNLSSDLKI